MAEYHNEQVHPQVSAPVNAWERVDETSKNRADAEAKREAEVRNKAAQVQQADEARAKEDAEPKRKADEQENAGQAQSEDTELAKKEAARLDAIREVAAREEAEAKRTRDERKQAELVGARRLQAKKDEDAREDAKREETHRNDEHQRAEAAREKAQREEAERREAQQRADAEKAEAERLNAEVRAKAEAARLQVIRDVNDRAVVEAARATQQRERAEADRLHKAIAEHLAPIEIAPQAMSMSELYDHLQALERPRTHFNRTAMAVELAAILDGVQIAIGTKAPDYAEMACAILMHPSLAFRLKE